jgi:hypothetical protein
MPGVARRGECPEWRDILISGHSGVNLRDSEASKGGEKINTLAVRGLSSKSNPNLGGDTDHRLALFVFIIVFEEKKNVPR